MDTNHWLWVFATIEGFRWVLDHELMAFPSFPGRRVERMGPGDRAVLHVARGAYGNPSNNMSRLGGLATVVGECFRRDLTIGGLDLEYCVPIQLDIVFPDRKGPEVGPLADELSFVKREDVWGLYFRGSPKPVSEKDFEVFEKAIHSRASSIGIDDSTSTA